MRSRSPSCAYGWMGYHWRSSWSRREPPSSAPQPHWSASADGCRCLGRPCRTHPPDINVPDVLTALLSLADKNLILVQDELRFRMLETAREFALELLESSGEA